MYAIDGVTFTINIPQMLAYIYMPYMDPMGYYPTILAIEPLLSPLKMIDLPSGSSKDGHGNPTIYR